MGNYVHVNLYIYVRRGEKITATPKRTDKRGRALENTRIRFKFQYLVVIFFFVS